MTSPISVWGLASKTPLRSSRSSIRYKMPAIVCPTPVHPPTISRFLHHALLIRLTGIMDSFSAFHFRCNGKRGGAIKRKKDR
ncbi:hypothetical protein BDW42DRAFT_107018 [Aspergillus taichungensis]|uniref:Uncharacterized protein n=1 Tax=Aspergillus taichungensis TaxID=482145 RepID=A0A2J5HTR6_9EURO|nr:hypothetical protein BDW42DRAFT_107018 [Aspergillus taichungensis]